MLLPLVEYFDIWVRILESCLVDFSSCIIYSLLFVLVAGLVIDGQLRYFGSLVGAHNGPAVSTVSHIELGSVEESNYCAGS